MQSVNVGPFAWFNTFVSAFSGFVGVGVGAAVIVATFLFRRPATPFVAFSAIYAAVYNIVNIIVLPAAADGRGTYHLESVGYSYPSGHVGFFVWLSVLAMVLLARNRLPRPLYIACWVLARHPRGRRSAEPHLCRRALAERRRRRLARRPGVDVLEPLAGPAHQAGLQRRNGRART